LFEVSATTDFLIATVGEVVVVLVGRHIISIVGDQCQGVRCAW
jgi:hypothetical protein